MEGVVDMIPNREFKLNELSKINSSASEIDGRSLDNDEFEKLKHIKG